MCLAHTAEVVREHAAQAPPRVQLDRRSLLKAGAGAGLVAALPGRAGAHPRRTTRHLRDLTYPFRVDFPVFVDSERPTREPAVTFADDGYYLQRWTFYEHTATHMDAPGHFVPGGRLAPEIRPRELLVPAVVVDISERARRDPDTQVWVHDLRRFERRHGRIPRRAVVLMDSGWQRFVRDEDAYRGTDASGTFHFPGFSAEAVDWLVTRRDITGIGVDTLSLDHGPSTTFETHVTLLSADRYGLENVANLDDIPRKGVRLFVGLVPWEQGSGGPCRVIARW